MAGGTPKKLGGRLRAALHPSKLATSAPPVPAEFKPYLFARSVNQMLGTTYTPEYLEALPADKHLLLELMLENV